MGDIYDEIEELKTYNSQLSKLLNDPHPGLMTWAQAVVTTIDKMDRVIHPPINPSFHFR